jgi:hypothetical protein
MDTHDASAMKLGQASLQLHGSGLVPQGAATLLQSGGGLLNLLCETLFG